MGAVHGVGHGGVERLLGPAEGIAQDLGQELARSAGKGDVCRGIGGAVVPPVDRAEAVQPVVPAASPLSSSGARGEQQRKAEKSGSRARHRGSSPAAYGISGGTIHSASNHGNVIGQHALLFGGAEGHFRMYESLGRRSKNLLPGQYLAAVAPGDFSRVDT
jgi:hypothetical protein